MALPLNEKSEQLLNVLLNIPPDLSAAEKLLQQERFSSDELTKVAMRYADECFLDIADIFRTNPDDRISFAGFIPPPGVVPGLHSTHLYDVVKLLLNHG